MDARRFDHWTRALGGAPSRRQALRALAGGLLAAAGFAPTAGARSCRTNGDCGPCETCDRRRGRCTGGCTGGKLCCDGRCEAPGRCCTRPEHCGPERGCQSCVNGRCRPLPNGRECAGCKRCVNGECTREDERLTCDGICCADDELCVGVVDEECCKVERACGRDCCKPGERCTREDGCCPEGRQCGASDSAAFPFRACCDADETCVGGKCCPRGKKCGGTCCEGDRICNRRTQECCVPCADGSCCPTGQQCVDSGFLGQRFCCDQPCGERADGTFRKCCDLGQSCVDGVCEADCPSGRRTAGGVCCDAPEQVCRRFGDEEFCCPRGQICCRGGASGRADICCKADRCLRPGLCCAEGAEVKCSGESAHCAPPENVCCGEFSCPDCNTC